MITPRQMQRLMFVLTNLWMMPAVLISIAMFAVCVAPIPWLGAILGVFLGVLPTMVLYHIVGDEYMRLRYGAPELERRWWRATGQWLDPDRDLSGRR